MADNNGQGTAVAPQGTAVAPQGTAVAPQGTALAGSQVGLGTGAEAQGTAVAPQGTAAARNAAAALRGAAAGLKGGGSGGQDAGGSGRGSGVQGSAGGSGGVAAGHKAGEVLRLGGKSYTVQKLLGRGSEGELYLVSDNRKKYALKCLNKGFSTNQKVVPALKKLSGKGYIADLVDCGKDYELMEFYPEGNAAAAGLKGNANAILAIAVKTAMSLDELHRQGVLHKDVKPANILIKDRTSYDCVLCDFGIADIMDANGKCATLQVRTPIYAAPEVYSDNVNIEGQTYIELSAKSDFYSLGMTILLMWTGESAFLAQEHKLALDKVKGRISVPSDMPDPLARICRGLLIKNPAKRWDWGEIELTLNGREVPVEEDSIVEDLNITFNASRHITANSPEELAACMLDDFELGIKYLYRGMVEKWLKPYPELVLEIQDIVENRYPDDQETGLMAAVYTLDPTLCFPLSGNSRESGEATSFNASTLKDIGDYCNASLPDDDTKGLLESDIFVEWVRVRSADIASRLPAPSAYVPGYILRVQTVSPMSDINLLNNPSDKFYAMDQKSLGAMLNTIYCLYWGKFKGDPQMVLDHWEDKSNAPYGKKILKRTVLNIVTCFMEPDKYLYLTEYFKVKGERFRKMAGWYDYCTDYKSNDNKKKAGPKDSIYRSQTAWMKVISGFADTAWYQFFPDESKLSNVSDALKLKKSLLKEHYNNGGLAGWLAVQHHENPKTDLTQQFSYEKLLYDYLEDIRKIDAEATPVKRFDQAQKEAARILSSGKVKVHSLSTRSVSQMVFTVIFAVIPCIILLAMLVFTIIDHPLVDTSGLKLERFFWPLGLIVAAIIFFNSDDDGCLVPIIGGVFASAVIFFLIKLLGKFILYFFAAIVLFVLIFFSIKTLFNKSAYADKARRFSKPGFDEQVLEPLYFAFGSGSKFDSSLNGAFNDHELGLWKADLKRRRWFVIIFIVLSWVLMAFSLALPGSRGFDRFFKPLIEKALPESVPELIQSESLAPGAKGEEVLALQNFLKSEGYLKATPDGDFGAKTKAAVAAFQKANGLEASGTADKPTIQLINKISAESAKSAAASQSAPKSGSASQADPASSVDKSAEPTITLEQLKELNKKNKQ